MGRLAELQRKNLEHLMGAEAMGIIQIDLKFTDPKVCRSFLCGHCPHDLFTNTKMDLGACPKTHSQKLKVEYEASAARSTSDNPEEVAEAISPHELAAMRREYESNIHSFVDECDRRIRAAQKRLEKTPEENNRTTALMREIGEIQTAFEGAMAEVEALGEAGKVDQSMAELAKAEALKSEKLEKERELQQLTETSGASGHQKLRVCDICGAYLSILDSDRRLADHFGGKMHLGYLQLRQTIEEWRKRPQGNGGPAGGHSLSAGVGAAHYAGRNGPPQGAPPAAPKGPAGSQGPPQPNGRGPSSAPIPQGSDAGNSSSRDHDRDRDDHKSEDRHGSRRDDRHSSSRRHDDEEHHRSSHRDREHDDNRRSSGRRDDDDKRRHDDDGRGHRDEREKRRRYE